MHFISILQINNENRFRSLSRLIQFQCGIEFSKGIDET